MTIPWSQEQVERAMSLRDFSVLNQILYRAAREMPLHNDVEIVASKLMLIGRTYAAALERHVKRKGERVSAFYESISKRLCESDIDEQIAALRGQSAYTPQALEATARLHGWMVRSVCADRPDAKRPQSFVSKYLHFHLPQHMPIFDNISSTELKRRLKVAELPPMPSSAFDEFWRYGIASLQGVQMIRDAYGMQCTWRDFDTLLQLPTVGQRRTPAPSTDA